MRRETSRDAGGATCDCAKTNAGCGQGGDGEGSGRHGNGDGEGTGTGQRPVLVERTPTAKPGAGERCCSRCCRLEAVAVTAAGGGLLPGGEPYTDGHSSWCADSNKGGGSGGCGSNGDGIGGAAKERKAAKVGAAAAVAASTVAAGAASGRSEATGAVHANRVSTAHPTSVAPWARCGEAACIVGPHWVQLRVSGFAASGFCADCR